MQFRSMFGAAEWVTLPASDADSMLFRAPFVTERPLKAMLTVVGLGVFEAYINGRAVSGDRFLPLNSDYAPREFSVRGNPFGEITAHRLYVPVYDVTNLVADGENVLAISKKLKAAPGEMEKITVKAAALQTVTGPITVNLEELA
jgi:hypothetical protein